MAAVGEDDAAWERAISAATKSTPAPKTLALDGIVKSATGRLPSASLLDPFAASLEELSVAGARLASLEGLPRLPALRRLSLPDNRLAGAPALAAVAGACGATLRHLDLGNNRFADVQELAPLAGVRVESLDLYQCPVTKVKGYREKVFALIPSLKYLDGADAEGNERLETDDEEDDDEEEDEEGEEGEEGEGVEGEEDGEEEDDGEEGDEEDGEDGEGDEEEEEGDEEAEDEDGEAEDDEADADTEDKENIESKAGSSLPNKRKRDSEDDANGDK